MTTTSHTPCVLATSPPRCVQELLQSGHSKKDILNLRRDIAARLGITDEDPLAPVADQVNQVPSHTHVQPFTIDLLPDRWLT